MNAQTYVFIYLNRSIVKYRNFNFKILIFRPLIPLVHSFLIDSSISNFSEALWSYWLKYCGLQWEIGTTCKRKISLHLEPWAHQKKFTLHIVTLSILFWLLFHVSWKIGLHSYGTFRITSNWRQDLINSNKHGIAYILYKKRRVNRREPFESKSWIFLELGSPFHPFRRDK